MNLTLQVGIEKKFDVDFCMVIVSKMHLTPQCKSQIYVFTNRANATLV